MTGISTCYWSENAKTPVEIIEEIMDIGFNSIELEYRISEN